MVGRFNSCDVKKSNNEYNMQTHIGTDTVTVPCYDLLSDIVSIRRMSTNTVMVVWNLVSLDTFLNVGLC